MTAQESRHETITEPLNNPTQDQLIPGPQHILLETQEKLSEDKGTEAGSSTPSVVSALLPGSLCLWTRGDAMLIIVTLFIVFGDAVEIYLPGVINQAVSCDLSITPTEESILGITLYIFLTISAISTILLSVQLGRRNLLLLSLYGSVIFTVVSCLVPNYFTLLISRALTGVSVGINFSTVRLYFAQNASSRKVIEMGLYMSTAVWGLGSFWVAVLGWLLLGTVGWRVLILLASMPFFIPPIAMLHCCSHFIEIRETETPLASSTQHDRDTDHGTITSGVRMRVAKLSIAHFITTFVWGGAIFLLPALIRLSNLRWMLPGNGCIEHVVHGTQFLIIAGVMGVANMLGKPLGYIARYIFPFKLLQPVLSLAVVVSYTFLLVHTDIIIFSVLIGIGKFASSMQEIELGIITYDQEYYGTSDALSHGSAVVVSSSFFGGVVGTSLAAFMDTHVVIVVTIVMGIVQVFVICLVQPTQRDVRIQLSSYCHKK